MSQTGTLNLSAGKAAFETELEWVHRSMPRRVGFEASMRWNMNGGDQKPKIEM